MNDEFPPAPVNVQLVMCTDEIVPVSCLYRYRDDEGVHLWEVIMPDNLQGHVVGLKADELPPMASIGFPMAPGHV